MSEPLANQKNRGVQDIPHTSVISYQLLGGISI